MTIQHFNTITGFACISIRPLGCTGCPCVYRIAQGTYRLYMSLGPYRIFMHLYVPRAIYKIYKIQTDFAHFPRPGENDPYSYIGVKYIVVGYKMCLFG